MDPTGGPGPPSSARSQSLSMFPFTTNSQQHSSLNTQINTNQQNTFDNTDSFVNTQFLANPSQIPLHTDMQSSLLPTNYQQVQQQSQQQQSHQQSQPLQNTQSTLIGELEKAIATNVPKPSNPMDRLDVVQSQQHIPQQLQLQLQQHQQHQQQQQQSTWSQISPSPNLLNHQLTHQQKMHLQQQRRQQHFQQLQRAQLQSSTLQQNQQNPSRQITKPPLTQQQLVNQQLYHQQLRQRQQQQQQQQQQFQLRRHQLHEEQFLQLQKAQLQREQHNRLQQVGRQSLQQNLPSAMLLQQQQQQSQNRSIPNVPPQSTLSNPLLNGSMQTLSSHPQQHHKKTHNAPARRPRTIIPDDPGQSSLPSQVNIHGLLAEQIDTSQPHESVTRPSPVHVTSGPNALGIVPGSTNAQSLQSIGASSSLRHLTNNLAQAQFAQHLNASVTNQGGFNRPPSNPNLLHRISNQSNIYQQRFNQNQRLSTSDPLSNDSRFDPTKLQQLIQNTTDPKHRAELQKQLMFCVAARNNDKLQQPQLSDQPSSALNTQRPPDRSQVLPTSTHSRGIGSSSSWDKNIEERKQTSQQGVQVIPGMGLQQQSIRQGSLPNHSQPGALTRNTHTQAVQPSVQSSLPTNTQLPINNGSFQLATKDNKSTPFPLDGSQTVQGGNRMIPIVGKQPPETIANKTESTEPTKEEITLGLYIQKRKRLDEAPTNDFQRVFGPDYVTPFTGRVDAWQRLLPYHILHSESDDQIVEDWNKSISTLGNQFKQSLHSLQEKWNVLKEASCKPANSADSSNNDSCLTVADDIILNHVLIEEHYKSIREEAAIAQKRAAEAAAKAEAEKRAAEMSAMRAVNRARQARGREQAKAEKARAMENANSAKDNTTLRKTDSQAGIARSSSQIGFKNSSRGGKSAKRSPRDSPTNSSRHGTELSTGTITNNQSPDRRVNTQSGNIPGSVPDNTGKAHEQASMIGYSSVMNSQYPGVQPYQRDNARISAMNTVLGRPQMQQKEKHNQFTHQQSQYKPYYQHMHQVPEATIGGDSGNKEGLLSSHMSQQLTQRQITGQGGIAHQLLQDPSTSSQPMNLNQEGPGGSLVVHTAGDGQGISTSDQLKNRERIGNSFGLQQSGDDTVGISSALSNAINGQLNWGSDPGSDNNGLSGMPQQTPSEGTADDSGG